MEEKVTMGLKMNFSNHWLMVRLNLSFDNIRNVKEQLHSWKNLKKGILNYPQFSIYKQGFLFEKFKESDKENGVTKTHKVSEKYPKLEVVMNLKSFNDVEIC